MRSTIGVRVFSCPPPNLQSEALFHTLPSHRYLRFTHSPRTGSQSRVPGPASSASPGNLLEIQGPQIYQMRNSGGGAQQSVSTDPPGDADTYRRMRTAALDNVRTDLEIPQACAPSASRYRWRCWEQWKRRCSLNSHTMLPTPHLACIRPPVFQSRRNKVSGWSVGLSP